MPMDPYGYPSETHAAYADEAYWKEQDRNRHSNGEVELIQPPIPVADDRQNEEVNNG